MAKPDCPNDEQPAQAQGRGDANDRTTTFVIPVLNESRTLASIVKFALIWLGPKPNRCCRTLFPLLVRTSDKEHGRIVQRSLANVAVDSATLGLAGAARVYRIDCQIDYLRRGQVYKTTHDIRFGVTRLDDQPLPPARLLQAVRDSWVIGTRQHYRLGDEIDAGPWP